MTLACTTANIFSNRNSCTFISGEVTPVPEGEAMFDKTTPEFDSTSAVFDDATRQP